MKEYINKILGGNTMKNNNVQIEDIMVLIDQYFKILDKKISENEKEILLLFKEIKKAKTKADRINEFDSGEIKIVSYLDN
ncbi:MAG TPA: hypothetical protein PK432_00805 [Candidatus Dojkabacteria bacterium]|nr:hypothetical protein [Candidatus Dojkabacteria bacterium]HPP18489.1 hypothetical protein [Candidatus Dojkabacteria bacterium]